MEYWAFDTTLITSLLGVALASVLPIKNKLSAMLCNHMFPKVTKLLADMEYVEQSRSWFPCSNFVCIIKATNSNVQNIVVKMALMH